MTTIDRDQVLAALDSEQQLRQSNHDEALARRDEGDVQICRAEAQRIAEIKVLWNIIAALPAIPLDQAFTTLQQKYDVLRSWADGAEIDLAERDRAAELYRDLTDLVVAANRMLDNWAEGDQSVKNDLWRSLHTLAAEIADRQGLFPLGSPEGARLGVCGAAYQTDVGEGVETYFCQLPPHEGKHEWGVTQPKETFRALPVLETKKETE